MKRFGKKTSAFQIFGMNNQTQSLQEFVDVLLMWKQLGNKNFFKLKDWQIFSVEKMLQVRLNLSKIYKKRRIYSENYFVQWKTFCCSKLNYWYINPKRRNFNFDLSSSIDLSILNELNCEAVKSDILDKLYKESVIELSNQ